jgi:hypothetical protein
MRRDALNVLHQGVGLREDVRIDALQDDALCDASLTKDGAVSVVDVTAPIGRRGYKLPVDLKFADHLVDIGLSAHDQSLLG